LDSDTRNLCVIKSVYPIYLAQHKMGDQMAAQQLLMQMLMQQNQQNPQNSQQSLSQSDYTQSDYIDGSIPTQSQQTTTTNTTTTATTTATTGETGTTPILNFDDIISNIMENDTNTHGRATAPLSVRELPEITVEKDLKIQCGICSEYLKLGEHAKQLPW